MECFIPGKKNIIIGVVYRPPQSNLDLVVNEMQDILLNPLFVNKTIFLMGDYNANLLRYDENDHINAFLNMMLSFSLMPLIIKPTRVTDNSSTLIDNIFCNLQPFPSSGIIISDLSDHFPIFTRVNLQCNSYNHEVKYIRKNNPSNIAKFREALIAADWTKILHEQDVNTSFNCFVDRFMLLYNKNVPVVKHNTRDLKKNLRMPWIITSLLNSFITKTIC